MTTETTNVSDNQHTPAEQQGVELTINDLKAIQQIIDVASQRGAFRANELSSVGDLYNRLTAFLDFATKKGQ